ncbi:MAG: TolC family protein [Planctomycetes bacterium]|nr:TolC family protein [Planctomycetota bacterium]
MANRLKLICLCLLLATTLVAGCRTSRQIRDPEYAQVVRTMQRAQSASQASVVATAPVFTELAGPHAVEQYIQVALAQNPKIQAARKKMESFAHQVPVAASLPDPTLNVTALPEPVQTAAGQQEMIVAANQKFFWFDKLNTRASVAESQTNVARAQLAAVELATIADVKRAYYELYFIQQAILVTEAEQQLLVEIREVANTRYKAGMANQQDVLRADLEISNIENELIRLRQRLKSGQARLASLLHIAPQTQVAAINNLTPEQAPRDLELLQQQAVTARPELHALLAAVQRDRNSVNLARLDYKPDVTLGLSWIDVANIGLSPAANGRDSFLLSAGVNLPIYRKRLDSSVRSAEAKVVSTTREYDSLRDGTLEEVTDLLAQAHSQEDLLILFREDILPKARQTLEVSNQAYNVGEVDFLQLIDNWQQLLRYEVNFYRLEASLRQTLAELERVVGGFSGPVPEAIPAPLAEPVPLPPEENEQN